MMPVTREKLSTLALFLGAAALAAFACWERHLPTEICRAALPLSDLDAGQMSNICRAAKAVDGLVLGPGQEFSFNRTVGPRTLARGFLAARSYMGGDSPRTPGGGICLLSSALYRAALDCGLAITERRAHTRPTRSVPTGLDATVWWGTCDLRFVNSRPEPVLIQARADRGSLCVRFFSRSAGERRAICVERQKLPGNMVAALVTSDSPSGRRLISRDVYRLAR